MTDTTPLLKLCEESLDLFCRNYRERHGLDGSHDGVLVIGERVLDAVRKELATVDDLPDFTCELPDDFPDPIPSELTPVSRTDIEELWDAISGLRDVVGTIRREIGDTI